MKRSPSSPSLSRRSRPVTGSAAQVRSRRRFLPAIETLEDRRLLATGIAQGTAFVDNNLNGVFDSGDTAKVGTKIELRKPDGTFIADTLTDAQGTYKFDNLAPGTYRLIELTPAGYVSRNTHSLAQLNPGTQIAPNTIEVTITDPNTIWATYKSRGPNERVFFEINGTSTTDLGVQMNVSLGTAANGTNLVSLYSTFCVDLFGLVTPGDTFQVMPRSATESATELLNGGRVGYLYNHYAQSSLTAAQAAGLQIAIWELIYDSASNLDAGNFIYTGATASGSTPNAADSAAVKAAAQSYLNDSAGKFELALWLDPTFDGTRHPSRGQAVLAYGSYNFANVAEAKIGDFVWHDQNANGIQDGGEGGINGATVKLLDSGGNVIATTATFNNGTNDGYYEFGGLVPGSYSVQFVLPAGYDTFTAKDQSGDDAKDSDADTSTGKTASVTLAAGEFNKTLDAGVYKYAAIGDFVWDDKNANGVQDAGEPGISGATVKLLDAGGSTVATTTTDANGKYLFSGLTPGDYRVQFVTPAGYVLTGLDQGGDDTKDSDADGANAGKTILTNVTSGETDLTWDAGYYKLASLGDFVWDDLNANGQQDSGEPGISGVTVKLYDGGNNLVATTTTDGSGLYSFTGLTPGTYYVVFTAPGGYIFTPQDVGNDASDSDANTTTGKTGNYTLASGDNNTTVDAGLYRLAALGDFVWHDTNANGIQDGGEAGISGVTVKLYDTGNNLVASTTTDGSGGYLFSGLTPGTYYVVFTTPAGYVSSPKDQGGDDGKDSDANTTTGKTGNYTLVSGQTDLSVDAGYYKLASLGDFVWDDLNANGQQDSGEPGISGVTVKLYDGGNNLVATTTTDGSGLYSFTGLTPGTYYVVFTAPGGYVFTSQDVGNDASDSDANTSTGKTGNYTLASGQNNTTVDAGLYRPAALGDFVWHDTNANGIQDGGEAGISGVTVKLYDTGNNLVATTTTDGAGKYLFSGLTPGTYYVQFATPSGYVASPKDQGADDGKDSDADAATGKTGNYTLVSGQTDLSVDAGYYQYASLGDFVWEDLNGNGKQDAGEPGISGVSVELRRTSDDSSVATTTTNGSGYYSFTGLVPDTYYVVFTAPTGYVFTAPNQGGDDTKDSDVFNGSETGDYTLSSGENNLTVDAGLYRPAKLGDFVWNDLNGDGDQDAGEPGVLGVVVTLTGTDGAGNSVTKTTTTDSNGAYLFTDLAPGTYCVKFSNLPAGFIFTGKDLGGNDAKDSDADTTTGKTGDYTLASGDDNRTVDAGLFDTNAVKGSLAGFVYCDADNDGVKDAGEAGIGGVTIKLTGTDYLGRAVNLTTTTAADGSYKFTDLYKSNAAGYTITETQPGGYADGKDAVGSLGGTLGNDVLSAIVLGAGQNGVHYDFGERCGQVTTGMTATIGFWQNKNGQALIKSVNGGGSSTALGDWLASNFPNLFGTLAGKNNWDVAAYFVTLFKAKGPNAPKTEAQVMAGALAAYVTNSTLAGGNYAAGYGFTVNNSGTGAATWNVGDNGEAFGVADNTTLTVLQGLQLIDAQSTNGKVFPNDTAKRVQVNTFFTEINEAGDII